ncbi:MAG: hypothetical protein C5B55_13325 [Blastocatellia bacterium]|nr:MAG: hypothetical protein C5B55_13325 [Blastocatellia bacterium]
MAVRPFTCNPRSPIRAGDNLTSPNPLIFRLVSAGNDNALAALIAEGTDVNAQNEGGQTPLILAIISGQDSLIGLLLDAGANPLVSDHTGLNAIDWAERKGRSGWLHGLNKKREPRRKPESSDEASQPKADSASLSAKATQADEEKTQKFLAGLRQRFAEKPHQPRPPARQDIPQRRTRTTNADPVLLTTETPPALATEPKPELPPVTHTQSRPAEENNPAPHRKRCPKCNTIYDSPLLAYCSYHEVPLVDADATSLATPEAKSSSWPLWLLVLSTFLLALIATLFVSNLLFKSNREDTTPKPATQSTNILKGVPVAVGQLSGKAVLLPTADVPISMVQQPTSVIVQVRIDRSGKVVAASSKNNDETLREAAIGAAKRSSFSAEKLAGRGTEGTITYTFSPR